MASAGPSIPNLPDASWMRRAACKDADADALTPHEGEEEESQRLLDNRDLFCHGYGEAPCPVLNECRVWALATKVRTGIAGGLTAADRDELAGPTRRRSA
jgi:WhiB family transcriptional regulator, redox-sensing transcriptional regulator